LTSIDKDLPQKYLTKVLFEKLGYVAEIAVQITSKSYKTGYARQTYSDYDVLGVRFEPDLQLLRIAAECKSGEAKAVEELLKLKGVLTAFGIQRGYLIKSKIAQNARELAGNVGITTFSAAELQQFLTTAFRIDLDETLRTEAAANISLRTLDARFGSGFEQLWKYLRFEFWNRECHRNVQALLRLSASLSKQLDKRDSAHRFGAMRVLYYLSLALLELCGKVIAMGLSDPGRTFSVQIFGGARERREREVLFDMVHQYVPSSQDAVFAFEPDYMSGLSELAMRLIRSASDAAEIPRFLHGVIEEKFMGIGDRAGGAGTVTRKLSQDIALFVMKAAALDRAIFEELLAY